MSRVAALLALTLGVGCVAPEPDLSYTQQLATERLGEPVEWSAGVEPEEPTARAVRELIARDLSVDDAVRVALLRNLDLQALFEELGVGEAALLQAALPQNPTLHLDTLFPDTAPRSTAFEFEFAIDVISFLTIPARRAVAEAELAQTRLMVTSRVLELAGEVREAYYALQGASQVRALLQTSADTAGASFDYAKALHAAGNLSDLALATHRALWEEARIQVAHAELEVIDGRERLNVLLGLWGADTQWTIPATLPDLPGQDHAFEHLEAFAVARRLDLAAAQAEIDVVLRSLSLADTLRVLPTLHAGLAWDRDIEGNSAFGPSIELPLPLFDQGQAEVARLRSRQRQAEKRFAARAIEIRAEVRRVRNRLAAIRSLAAQYHERLIPAREEVVAQSLREYNFMLQGTFELVSAKRDQLDALRGYVESVRDYWITRAELTRVVGGRLPEGEALAVPGPPSDAPPPPTGPSTPPAPHEGY